MAKKREQSSATSVRRSTEPGTKVYFTNFHNVAGNDSHSLFFPSEPVPYACICIIAVTLQ